MILSIAQQQHIQAYCMAIGFNEAAFTDATMPVHNQAYYQKKIHEQAFGTMGWMYNPKRLNLKAYYQEAESVLVLGLNYAPRSGAFVENNSHVPLISYYAQVEDYHLTFKRYFERLSLFLKEHYPFLDFKMVSDTAPVMEKPFAHKAGIGWQGKHTNIVSQTYGSWLFLGLVILNVTIEPIQSPKSQPSCGRCTACIDHCPTQAITPYQLTIDKCLAYYFTEHKGIIPHPIRLLSGTRIYGCDDCLTVCPWNKFASTTKLLKEEWKATPSFNHLAFTESDFHVTFGHNPHFKRLGYNRFIRNLLIAFANSKVEGEVYIHYALSYLYHADLAIRVSALYALQQKARQILENIYNSTSFKSALTIPESEWIHFNTHPHGY